MSRLFMFNSGALILSLPAAEVPEEEPLINNKHFDFNSSKNTDDKVEQMKDASIVTE